MGGRPHNLEKEATGKAKSLVDLERVVQLRVVDESLPADGRAGLRASKGGSAFATRAPLTGPAPFQSRHA